MAAGEGIAGGLMAVDPRNRWHSDTAGRARAGKKGTCEGPATDGKLAARRATAIEPRVGASPAHAGGGHVAGDGPVGDRHLRLQTVNLSAHGVKVALDVALPAVGTSAHLRLEPPDAPPVDVEAIVWRADDDGAAFFFLGSSHAAVVAHPVPQRRPAWAQKPGSRSSASRSPARPKPMGNYIPAVRVGNLLFLSGHGPIRVGDQPLTRGKVGRDLSIEDAYKVAREVGINLLGSARRALGSLDKVKRVVKVLGMVNAVESFGDQPKVINGFSDLMVEVFGESGRRTRAPPSAWARSRPASRSRSR